LHRHEIPFLPRLRNPPCALELAPLQDRIAALPPRVSQREDACNFIEDSGRLVSEHEEKEVPLDIYTKFAHKNDNIPQSGFSFSFQGDASSGSVEES
jgi:hypothetical protein